MKLEMFGKSHDVIGELTSDLLLRCKGKIKILFGNKFIDLIKDGKLNVNTKFIYQTDELGTKDGIYVLDDSVWLVVNGEQINLKGETAYVSFLEAQETDSEQKYQALTNIGFLYKDLDSINESSLKNGIIYIESEKQLYTIIDGQIEKFTIEFPNSINKLFIIEKAGSETGAILIKGKGLSNSIAFDKFWIYSDEYKSVLESNLDISIRINNIEKLNISETYSEFKNTVISSMFLSKNATDNLGFRLYLVSGESTLEVDNLIVRNGLSSTKEIYPEFWLLNNNIIKSVENNDDINYSITFLYNNTYKVGDTLMTYGVTENEEIEEETVNLSSILFEVIEVSDNSVTVETNSSFGNIVGNYIFLIKTEDSIPIRIKDNNIDIVEYDNEPLLRIGNLGNGIYGIYSKEAIFDNAKSNIEIPITDSSQQYATTELFHKLLPKGSIIMFNESSEIPEGWAKCDGTNETPDLTDVFIKTTIFIIKMI